jgi:hypothetical protein
MLGYGGHPLRKTLMLRRKKGKEKKLVPAKQRKTPHGEK